MTRPTIEEMFRAKIAYGSVKYAARALGLRVHIIYNNQKKQEWRELQRLYDAGKLKIEPRDPKELDNASTRGDLFRKHIGQSKPIGTAQNRAPKPNFDYKPDEKSAKKRPSKTNQGDEDMSHTNQETNEIEKYKDLIRELEDNQFEMSKEITRQDSEIKKLRTERDAKAEYAKSAESKFEKANKTINMLREECTNHEIEKDDLKVKLSKAQETEQVVVRQSNDSDSKDTKFYKETALLYFEKYNDIKEESK